MTTPLTYVLAQTIRNTALNSYSDVSATEFLSGLIPALISLGLVVGAVVFLFYFLTGGIGWISSGGDKMKLEAAQKKITTAIVGLFILLSFFGILNVIECFFGIGLRGLEVGSFYIGFVDAPWCTSEPDWGPEGWCTCSGGSLDENHCNLPYYHWHCMAPDECDCIELP